MGKIWINRHLKKQLKNKNSSTYLNDAVFSEDVETSVQKDKLFKKLVGIWGVV